MESLLELALEGVGAVAGLPTDPVLDLGRNRERYTLTGGSFTSFLHSNVK